MALEATKRLLETSIDGQSMMMDDLLTKALDDDRYLERIPELEELLSDPGTPREDRWLIVNALAAWGRASGLEAVLAAALDPGQSPFRGPVADRWHGADDSFTFLADSVHLAGDFVERFGTRELWLATARALIRLVGSEFFDWRLAWMVHSVGLPNVQADLVEAVEVGVRALEQHQADPLLGRQLADMAVELYRYDEAKAVDFAQRIVACTTSPPVLRRLDSLLNRGPGGDQGAGQPSAI